MSGESKQIDEDENGPENGGLKSGSLSNSRFPCTSCTSLSYYNPYRGVNKIRCRSIWFDFLLPSRVTVASG